MNGPETDDPETDDPETDDPAQPLRAEATSRLQDAARCGDPGLRDGLLREALALLGRARVLRAWAEDQAGTAGGHDGAAPPKTRTHRCAR